MSAAVEGCVCIDEWVCDACWEYRMKRYAYMGSMPRVDIEQAERDIREAGRGHLLLEKQAG